MLKKIDFTYNDANYNAEFLIEMLTSMKNSTEIKTIMIGTVDTVPNDQEKFSEKKGLFSEEVFEFNNQVRDSHGLKIDFDKIISVLKQCRTVWEISISMSITSSEIIPSLDDTEKTIDDNVVVELKLIEGDLFTLFYKEEFYNDNLLKVLDDNKIAIE